MRKSEPRERTYLDQRSRALKESALSELKSILVIDDVTMDADRLVATLRILLGQDVDIRSASTLTKAIDAVIAKQPTLIILDDILKPSDDATDTIPHLIHAGYAGPIIIVSGAVTRRRRMELLAAGASEIIHKDDLNSTRLVEIISDLLKGRKRNS